MPNCMMYLLKGIFCFGTFTRRRLRPSKIPSVRSEPTFFSDSKLVRVFGGKGGDGCVSFLRLWCNERAGPDGGDGGNGGHIIFMSSSKAHDLNHIRNAIKAPNGGKGNPNECHGKNGKNMVVEVPKGTIIRDIKGRIVGDLYKENLIFVAARGGCGGKGNSFFTNANENSPKVCEYGSAGEHFPYMLELRSMADIGLIGCPNAGKSTLLNAISRAKPKIAPYAFTTLRPHIGIVHYDDHEQVAVADLPGLIIGSNKNKGLGIQFLKHMERCSLLLFVIDASAENPSDQFYLLMNELNQFNPDLIYRPKLVVANKVDVDGTNKNLVELESHVPHSIIPISAKNGQNVSHLFNIVRQYIEIYRKNLN